MNIRCFVTLALFITQAVCGDTVVIDQNTLNGSFESGILDPWRGGSVVSNADFAADGQYYIQAVAERRAAVVQFFPATSSSMPTFTLSFQMRNGAPAFPTVNGSLSARRVDGSFIYASVVQATTPSPTDTEWRVFSYLFVFTETWDESQNMGVSVSFSGAAGSAVGYVDDVRLRQISHPTSILNMTVENESVSLSIQHRAPSTAYWIQRSSSLAEDNWLSVSNLNLVYPGIEWSEVVSNQWKNMFYRLKRE